VRGGVASGRASGRRILSMAALVASTHTPVSRTFSRRLLAAGTPRPLALVAGLRTLLVILGALVQHKTVGHASHPTPHGTNP